MGAAGSAHRGARTAATVAAARPPRPRARREARPTRGAAVLRAGAGLGVPVLAQWLWAVARAGGRRGVHAAGRDRVRRLDLAPAGRPGQRARARPARRPATGARLLRLRPDLS